MSDLGSGVTGKPALAVDGLKIIGDVKLGRDGVIRAKVKGNVRASGKLVLAAEAVVSGFVEGQDVRLEGRVDGGIDGRGQVWLGPKAVLRTRCKAKALRIELGADFKGELRVGN
jgi:cytoskeletal protein CcmA (bactofilin family)